MPPLALLGGLPWRLVGVLVGLLALAGVYFGVKHIGFLEAEKAHQAQLAAENATVGKAALANQARADGIAATALAASAADHASFEALRRKIANAKPSSCPLSSTLDDWLDGLRGGAPRTPGDAAAHPGP